MMKYDEYQQLLNEAEIRHHVNYPHNRNILPNRSSAYHTKIVSVQ